MSSPETNAAKPTAPPNPAQTVVRIILFAVLAYMIFALVYDFQYVFKTHQAKHDELSELIEKETARSADDRRKNGPTGPEEVQEVMGFAPSVPLEKKDHYYHERYTYRRALPWLTRNIDVYYKQYEGDTGPGIVSVAHTDEDIAESEPKGPVVPATDEPATEDGDKKGDTEKSGNDKSEDADKTTDEPSPEPAADTKTDGDKDSDKKATDEPSIDDANPPTKD